MSGKGRKEKGTARVAAARPQVPGKSCQGMTCGERSKAGASQPPQQMSQCGPNPGSS